jgi:hypothetical protein
MLKLKGGCMKRMNLKSPLFALAAAVLCALPVLADVPPLAGANFQVNVVTQGSQLNPAAAADAAGDFVIAWIDQGKSPITVKARLFDATGAATSGEIVVATLPGVLGAFPRVAMTPLGAFAVVWDDLQRVYLQRFDRQGGAVGSVVTIAPTNDPSHSPDIAMDAAGNAVVAWSVRQFIGDAIFLQRFDPSNLPLAAPEQINQVVTGTRDNPRIALGSAGSLLVSWDFDRTVVADVYARRFDGPTGAWSPEVRINPSQSGVQQGSSPVLFPNGEGAVLFSDLTAGTVQVRQVDTTGAPAGNALQLGTLGPESTISPAVVGADGTVLVAWQGSDRHIHGGFFDQTWQPVGATLAVSTPIPGSIEWAPALAAGGPGGFVAAWNNGGGPSLFPISPVPPVPDGADGSQIGVFAQRLATASACAPGLLCLGDGQRFTAQVSWTNPNNGQTGTGTAVPLTGDTGAFWFFDPANLELMIKVLDGGAVNGHFWVYYGSLSSVEYTITVTDTATGAVKTYHNAPGQLASQADVNAFPSSSTLAARTDLRTDPRTKAAPAAAAAAACDPTQGLCLDSSRFQVQVAFTDPLTAAPGQGRPVPLTGDTGSFWFFDPANLELMIKVLDARAVNGHFWVFYGALSDVDYTITVTDTTTGQQRTYHNAAHQLASSADFTAF